MEGQCEEGQLSWGFLPALPTCLPYLPACLTYLPALPVFPCLHCPMLYPLQDDAGIRAPHCEWVQVHQGHEAQNWLCAAGKQEEGGRREGEGGHMHFGFGHDAAEMVKVYHMFMYVYHIFYMSLMMVQPKYM